MKHDKDCNCYDCLEMDALVYKANLVNYAEPDPNEQEILKYFDSIVLAKKPFDLVRFNADGSTSVLRKVKKGERIGTIVSYIDRNDKRYLQLAYFSGKNAGFVHYVPGLFDFNTLKSTSYKAKTDANVTKRLAENTNPLYKAGVKVTNTAKEVGENIAETGVNLSGFFKFVSGKGLYIGLVLVLVFLFIKYGRK